jgi:predicted nucleotidyltransferase
MSINPDHVRSFLRSRAEKRRENLNDLAGKAQGDFEKIVEMLIRKYDPTRIYQWGSLLDHSTFREWSDIDIAIEGLKNSLAGLHAAGDASQMTSFPVDLVEMERIHSKHAETIRKEGRLIYEKNN